VIGETHAHRRVIILARTHQQHEARHGHALAIVGGEEFRTPHETAQRQRA